MVDSNDIATGFLRRKASDPIEEFEQRILIEADSFGDKQKIAKEMFDLIADGWESFVFAVDQDRILKLSQFRRNLRAEYVIFSDPQFKHITPDAYDHGMGFQWITVERVDVFERWYELHKTFPELIDWLDGLPFAGSTGRVLGEVMERVQENDPPSSFFDLPDRDREWVRQVTEIFDVLGLVPGDMKPENLGIKDDGHVVLIDIWVDQ